MKKEEADNDLALLSLDELVGHKLRSSKIREGRETHGGDDDANVVAPPTHLLKQDHGSRLLHLTKQSNIPTN